MRGIAAIQKKLPFDTYDLIQLHVKKIEHYKYDSSKPQDDFLTIIEEAIKADTIVFATPVYWYAMSGMMKVFFDRFPILSLHQEVWVDHYRERKPTYSQLVMTMNYLLVF